MEIDASVIWKVKCAGRSRWPRSAQAQHKGPPAPLQAHWLLKLLPSAQASPETPLLQGSWVWHPWPLPGPLHPPTAQIPLANTLPSIRFTLGNTPQEPAEAPPASASWAELSGEGRSQLLPLTPAFGGEAPASKDKICRKREGTCTMAGETPETPGDGLPCQLCDGRARRADMLPAFYSWTAGASRRAILECDMWLPFLSQENLKYPHRFGNPFLVHLQSSPEVPRPQ